MTNFEKYPFKVGQAVIYNSSSDNEDHCALIKKVIEENLLVEDCKPRAYWEKEEDLLFWIHVSSVTAVA